MDSFTSPATLPGTGAQEPSVTAGENVFCFDSVYKQNLLGGILELHYVVL